MLESFISDQQAILWGKNSISVHDLVTEGRFHGNIVPEGYSQSYSFS